MPATVTCPSCNATLKPKTPLRVGARIKCPKCQNVFVVPADEDEDEAPTPPAPKPAAPKPAAAAPPARTPKPAPPPEEEEEDDDAAEGADDDAATEEDAEEGAAKPKKKGVPVWVWLASGAGVLVLVCCGGCTGLYYALPGMVSGMLGVQTGGESASVTMANYNQIKKDMTEADVKGIMGAPTMSLPLGDTKVSTWTKGSDTITVTLTKDKVTDRSCHIGAELLSGFGTTNTPSSPASARPRRSRWRISTKSRRA